jgi:hypothetical protein
MNPPELAEIETRLRRLERHNRILIGLLCVLASAGSIAATNHSISTANEVRTSHLTLVDNHGKPLVETRGINGVEYRSYLPHDVVQR